MQKRLMVLGAGPGQLPIIQRAVAMGCHVITVDYLPDNIGHKLSQASVNCSTVDVAGVLAAARELRVDGIVTFASDVATATVGAVAAALGLPGCPPAVAETMSNKARFRRFQAERPSLKSPGFTAGTEFAVIAPQIEALRWPVMFKPVDTSGSRGVTSVATFDMDACAAAFAYAQQYSRSGLVCAEEYVEGEDVSGDGFLVQGQLYAVITQKYKQGYVPTGHSLPTHLSRLDQDRIFAEVMATCAALGYTDGPIDFDVRVAPDYVTVLEMSPRLGGNGIPMLVARSTEFDLVKATIHYALGAPVHFPARLEVIHGSGSLVWGSASAGQVVRVATSEDVHRAVSEVFQCVINCRPGDDVNAFTHGGEFGIRVV
ncbi:MAG: ATP-grasp domain-containing protein [Anaerolineales bacterium]|nr:ATP-grasp domain-containing protein [Anaerolineales bacterium]